MQVRICELDGKIGADIVYQVLASPVYLRKEGKFFGSITTDSDDVFSTKLMRRVFDTNIFGLMDVTTAALPYLRKSKNGRMVVFGSRSAWRAEIPVSAILNSQYNSELNPYAYQILVNRLGHILLTIQLFPTICVTHQYFRTLCKLKGGCSWYADFYLNVICQKSDIV